MERGPFSAKVNGETVEFTVKFPGEGYFGPRTHVRYQLSSLLIEGPSTKIPLPFATGASPFGGKVSFSLPKSAIGPLSLGWYTVKVEGAKFSPGPGPPARYPLASALNNREEEK